MNADTPPPVKQKNWFARNWFWFVPTGCLSMVAIGVAGVVGILFFVTSLMKNSEPYIESMQLASEHPAVIEQLGQPLKAGRFTMGSINLHNDSGTADIIIPLSGPKGSATIYVVAEKAAGVWSYEIMEIQIGDSSDRIDLRPGLMTQP